MATKLGFQIESGLASEYLTDSKFIKDTYYVVANREALAGLKIVNQSDKSGSLCFVEDARTAEEISEAIPAYGKYFKYDAVNQTWSILDASDVQLNDSQNLDQILPTKYQDSSNKFIKTLLLSEDEYYDLPYRDPQILYLLYESDIPNPPLNPNG